MNGFGPVSAEAVLWAARQAVRQHSEPPSPDRATGRCRQCQPGGGCRMLAWALGVTRETGWHVERDGPEADPAALAAHEGWPLGGRVGPGLV